MISVSPDTAVAITSVSDQAVAQGSIVHAKLVVQTSLFKEMSRVTPDNAVRIMPDTAGGVTPDTAGGVTPDTAGGGG